MGMDMLLALAKEPQMSPAAKAWCDSLALSPEALQEVERRVLLARVARLEISEVDLEHLDYLLEEEQESEEALRGYLEHAVVELAGVRRDVTSVHIKGSWWMASGGPSWGDSPTDAYNLLTAVDSMRVTERSLSVREVKAAHVAMANA